MSLREQFEQWYVTNAFDYERNPLGSRDCALQRAAYEAGYAAARAEAEALLRESRDTIDWYANEYEHKNAKKFAQRIDAYLKGEKL